MTLAGREPRGLVGLHYPDVWGGVSRGVLRRSSTPLGPSAPEDPGVRSHVPSRDFSGTDKRQVSYFPFLVRRVWVPLWGRNGGSS